jgi:hypothetical protein
MPSLTCPETDCEMFGIEFASEEMWRDHTQREHEKPKDDPFKYAQENLAAALGLDVDGKATVVLDDRVKMGGTPMSREPSAKRAGDSKAQQVQMAKDLAPETPVSMSLDTLTTIDPSSLFSGLTYEGGGTRTISDLTLYRSATPNDTPESSKDGGSGPSEPNSDIAEKVELDIDINLGFHQIIDSDFFISPEQQSEEPGLYVFPDPDAEDTMEYGMERVDIDPVLMEEDKTWDVPEWDTMDQDFTNPLGSLDMGLYTLA